MDKIERKGWPKEIESVYKVMDFAGVRVVCNYIDDIYTVEESLLRQDDIKLLKRKDYIKKPKESGYRSLHLVVEVPIFLSDRTYHMPVEIQIRTIAMDTWASLEHELKYKSCLLYTSCCDTAGCVSPRESAARVKFIYLHTVRNVFILKSSMASSFIELYLRIMITYIYYYINYYNFTK